MRQGDLDSYVAYFEAWATAHPDLAFFCFGSVEKGIEFARSFDGFDYPFAWLEQPVIVTDDNGAGNLNEVFKTGISVLCLAPLDDRDAQVAAYARALRVLYSLQKQLHHDNKAGALVCELAGMKKETVSQLWADAHFGWRLEFDVAFNLNLFLC